MNEFRILAPTGALGAGFDLTAFERGVALRPHLIACDAGSTDSGPAALGSGTPKLSDAAVRRDLVHLLRARAELDVPLVVGSCGTSGRDDGVDRVLGIVRELAAVADAPLRVGVAYSGQSPETLGRLWDEGRIRPLPHAPAITRTDLVESTVVAMMGTEPIERLLADGCDVVLTGRASDTALFAALPHRQGFDPGLVWHAAKTIECGAACAVPPSANGLLATVRGDHFDVRTLADGSRLTAVSVAAHTLYENADPFRVVEPSGVLDTTDATYEQVDEQTVRVRGARFAPAEEPTFKLEGARLAGYQTIVVGGVRDRVVIERLPDLIPMAREHFAGRIREIYGGAIDPDDVDISYRLYGLGAVLGAHEPARMSPGEIGVLITITAPEQQQAHEIATFVAHVSSHLPIPEYEGLVTTIAYPFSPPEVDRGPVYAFTLNHVVAGVRADELFRTRVEVLP